MDKYSTNSEFTVLGRVHPESDTGSDAPPTDDPTVDPTRETRLEPTIHPTTKPSMQPTSDPTKHPIVDPTFDPSNDLTINPISRPTRLSTNYDMYDCYIEVVYSLKDEIDNNIRLIIEEADGMLNIKHVFTNYSFLSFG